MVSRKIAVQRSQCGKNDFKEVLKLWKLLALKCFLINFKISSSGPPVCWFLRKTCICFLECHRQQRIWRAAGVPATEANLSSWPWSCPAEKHRYRTNEGWDGLAARSPHDSLRIHEEGEYACDWPLSAAGHRWQRIGDQRGVQVRTSGERLFKMFPHFVEI